MVKKYISFNNNIKKILLVGVILFAISLLFYIIYSPGKRAIFLFESMDSDTLYAEYRYIPNDTAQGEIQYFIDELLLGPLSHRYKPLFANGTRTLSCFLNENNILYVHLNERALFPSDSSTETLNACNLLKKNVLKNYKYVDTIKVFIMGNLVAEM